MEEGHLGANGFHDPGCILIEGGQTLLRLVLGGGGSWYTDEFDRDRFHANENASSGGPGGREVDIEVGVGIGNFRRNHFFVPKFFLAAYLYCPAQYPPVKKHMKTPQQLIKVGAVALSLVACGSLQAASNVNTGQHKEANFNSGTSLSPFALRNTTNGNYVRVVSKRLKMYWAEANYRGNRNTRSAEIWSNMSTRGDVYVGFRLNIPTTSGSVRFPSNKNSIIAQFMQRTSSAGASTWCMCARNEWQSPESQLSRRWRNKEYHHAPC